MKRSWSVMHDTFTVLCDTDQTLSRGSTVPSV
jgi:hypothetical protein